MKPTLVIGATPNPAKYAYTAVTRLREAGHPVIAFGLHAGTIGDVKITTEWSTEWDIDTVTLYMNPTRQEQFRDAIIDLKPKRVLFNPGTENKAFEEDLEENGIEAEEACTLVLLSLGRY